MDVMERPPCVTSILTVIVFTVFYKLSNCISNLLFLYVLLSYFTLNDFVFSFFFVFLSQYCSTGGRYASLEIGNLLISSLLQL